jgi:hypothetical protein
MRFFNTNGPMEQDIHYMIPPLSRMNQVELLSLIDQRKYFILHAPRQTGKSSCMRALVEELNRGGRYRAIHVNLEPAQASRDDVDASMLTILGALAGRAESILGDSFMMKRFNAVLSGFGGGLALNRLLAEFSAHDPRPVVLILDEIDSLVGDTLISVLRQIRSGYEQRPKEFPQTVILCGVRDVRDYRIHTSGKEIITGGSAFNIKSESLVLGNFTPAEIRTLYELHTAETGQRFEEEIYPLVWDLTAGQPWLVNALAYEICFRADQPGYDRSRPVTIEMVEAAKDTLILRRDTHLDQLADKLKEPRVQRIIEPILTGESFGNIDLSEDLQYVIDLGLIRQDPENGIVISNRIYSEIIPRTLGAVTQVNLESIQKSAWYVTPEGRLDFDKLLGAFQQFFRENAEIWVDRFDYREAGPHLLLQAFLQRIVNGGGRVEREYGLGRKRTDLLVIWPTPKGVQRVVIELKLLHRNALETVISKGVEQTAEYLDRCGAENGHLVIFDRESSRSWEERIFRRNETVNGRTVTVWGV